MVTHIELVYKSGSVICLFLHRLLVLLQLLVQSTLAKHITQPRFLQLRLILRPHIRSLRKRISMPVLIHLLYLPFVSVDVSHVVVEVRFSQLVVGRNRRKRVGSILLEIVFVGEVRFVGSGALKLELVEAVDVVVATVDTEFAFVVDQFVGSIEIEIAFMTSVLFFHSTRKHNINLYNF